MTALRRLAVLAAVVVVAGFAGCRPLVVASMTPRASFDDSPPPAAPDYDDPDAWSALPDRVDAGDAVPVGTVATPPDRADVDVFYLHPTTAVGRRWNAPTADGRLNDATDRVATGLQAPAFTGRGVVFAPRYRQANGTAFFAPSVDGDRAIDIAYSDVERAFDLFLARRPPGRGFVLAGHSQGSVLGERLLAERISGTSLADALVVAVLPGGRVPAAGVGSIPACATPEQFGCVVAWNAREPGYEAGRFELAGEEAARLCTNPLTWRLDDAPAPAASNLGAVFLERDGVPRPGFADARCAGGRLVVAEHGRAPRDLPSRILDHVIGPGNLHPVEVQLYFLNIRENVDRRVTAFLANPS